MRELNLHIGHTKTGSSYVQYFLAKNHETLRRNGIAYPLRRDEVVARSGKITSGNASIVQYHRNFGFEQLSHERVLFSGERLFGDHGNGTLLGEVADYAERFDVSRINVLLLIRDPIPHLTSEYNQLVKRKRFVAPIEDFARRYAHPMAVARLIEDLSRRPEYRLTIRNYRLEKDRLPAVFKEWLGLDFDLLHDPSMNINRSLTVAEMEVLKRLNLIESCDWTFADRLCEGLPTLEVVPGYPSLDCQSETLERLAEAMAYVNGHLPPEHRYEAAPIPQPVLGLDQTTLSKSQVDILRECLAQTVERLAALSGEASGDIAAFRAIDRELSWLSA